MILFQVIFVNQINALDKNQVPLDPLKYNS